MIILIVNGGFFITKNFGIRSWIYIMEIKNKESELVFYFVDVQTKQTKENKKDNEQQIEQKKKNNIPMKEYTDDSLNKLVYDIFHVREKYGKYEKGNRYYVINDLQMNLIINEVEWHGEFNEYILKKKVKLQSREVLLLYQVFVTRILYMILINHNDNLADYVKTNDLKLKFNVLCNEFVKSIPDFETNENALNFLFDKILDTENCVDENKNDNDINDINDINEMKHEILSCVKNLLENENDDSKESYEFELCSNDKNKEVKTSSCRITGDGNKDENKNNDDDELELNIGIEKTKWQKDLGKKISLRQTEKIKMQNDIDYNKLKPIGDLLKNNKNHPDEICKNKWGKGKKINDKTPISYRMLLPYLDKKNENADTNFEAILNYYIENKWQSKYLNSIIKVGILSFKEIFMPNSVLKEYWTKDKKQDKESYDWSEGPKDNFEELIKNLNKKDFCISYRNFGIFKYKDEEDGNLYTYHLVLENLGDFCETEQIVNNYEYDDQYKKLTHEIKVKSEYENDFKNIKIKPNTFSRITLITSLANLLVNWHYEEKYQKDILNQLYYQCLKLIPIEQLLKTKIYDNTKIKYLCDFDMLNDINDKCENIEQMTKQIMKEAMIKNDAIKMDTNNKLNCFGKLDKKDQDDYIKKDYNYYNIFEGNNLFEIMSKKLKDETIEIRPDNHEVIKTIFKTFKYKFNGYEVNENEKYYFSQCCDLVKELCAKYKDEKEFITYELFGTMLDHLNWFGLNIRDYAKILFQLDDSSDNKNYKFTTDQEIGFLKLLIDKSRDENEKGKDNPEIRIQIEDVFRIMIQQNTSVKLDQKVIDFLFLNINDAKCLDSLLSIIYYKQYNLSLSLNVVKRMFDLFINDKNLQDDMRRSYLQALAEDIILNNKINFISDDKKQDDEIKDAKEKQRQIRLNFIKTYLKKIKGNKKLISNGTLNAFFKYFDDSLEIKKQIANSMKEYGLKIEKENMFLIFRETKREDSVEIKKILLKGSLRFGKTGYIPKSTLFESKNYKRSNSFNEKQYFCNYNNSCLIYDDYECNYNIDRSIVKDDYDQICRKFFLLDLYENNNKVVINKPRSENSREENIPPANLTQQESFFNWSIYFAIALIVAIVILTFVFKEPCILFALLAPIIIFVYRRYIQRCKKNNPKQEKPNVKTNDKDGKTSLLDKTQNMNLMVNKQVEKIILDGNTNSKGYIDNLNQN